MKLTNGLYNCWIHPKERSAKYMPLKVQKNENFFGFVFRS